MHLFISVCGGMPLSVCECGGMRLSISEYCARYEDANLLVLLAYYFDAMHWSARGPDAEVDAVAFNIGFGVKPK